jgi:hypothetical protein
MKDFNLIGGGFQHAHGSTLWKVPKHVKWHYESNEFAQSVYVDNDIKRGIEEHQNGKQKFGWILESRFISQGIVDDLKENLDIYKEAYEFILTHHKELLQIDSEFFKWCPAYGTYIDNIKIYNKSKICSMIASGKSSTKLHRVRFDILNKLSQTNLVDTYGRETNPIDKKEDGLCDYMFSIAIENDSYETYFTEKLLDCFATGTVPLYIGAPDIGEHFDSSGIINLTSVFDFKTLTKDLYESKKEGIQNNLEKTRELDILDDWIFLNYLTHY